MPTRTTLRLRKRKKLFVDAMGGCCQICGYNHFYGALDFHHIDPSKKDVIIGSIRKPFDKKLLTELKKCVVLCSNCHREVHHGEALIPDEHSIFDENLPASVIISSYREVISNLAACKCQLTRLMIVLESSNAPCSVAFENKNPIVTAVTIT